MIVGIGTDITSIERMRGIQTRLGDRFAQRILTPSEFDVYVQRQRAANYLATRFAAKEAAAKALGTGIGKVSFHDLETAHTPEGAPVMIFLGYAAELQKNRNIERVHLSLSDEEMQAVAFVVLEGGA